jgi:NADPH:quinone reductase-like Zn-dependent oxidoreductase
MTTPDHMSGVLLVAHGGPESLVWSDSIPVPHPRRGEALIRVAAAGVNNTDINTRTGWYSTEVSGPTQEGEAAESGGWAGALEFPRIQGGDLCGHVVALGDDTAGPALGARVICPTNQARPTADNPFGFVAIGSEFDGAFAQFCCVPVDQLYDVTASPLSDVELAAMPCAFGTAANLLSRAGVVSGSNVLITGASGGVGLAAVALAKALGARVAGICGASKAWSVLQAGADHTILRGGALPKDSFDMVIDVVAGPGWMDLIDALRPGGHYAISGAIAGPIVEADLRRIYLRDITLHGCTYQPPEIFAALVEKINAGQVRPLVSKTYSLLDIGAAQADFMSKTFPGKLVLIPPEITP